jgi:hypothetical protein
MVSLFDRLPSSPTWITRCAYRGLHATTGFRLSELAAIDLTRLDQVVSRRPLPDRIELCELDSGRIRCLAEKNHHLDPVLASCVALPNHRCFAALDGPFVIGYTWIARDGIDCQLQLGIPIQLPSSAAVVQYSFVERYFFRKGVHAHLFRFAIQQLKPRGIQTLVAFFDWADRAARQVYRHSSFSGVGSVLQGGSTGNRLLRLSSGAKLSGIHFGLPPSGESAPLAFRPLPGASY